MTYSFVCKKCGFHCESLTKEKRREAEAAHKVKRADGTWGCANMKRNTKTQVMRRDQIVSMFD